MKSNRRKLTFQLVFAIAIIIQPWLAPDVYGCQCREREPPCAQYSRADAVFIGSVTSIRTSDANSGKTIHFNIERASRGVSSRTAEIVNHGTSCDYSFTEREKYLVYAYRNSERNELNTNDCTRTTELSNAGTDLTYLKEHSEKGQPLQIIGVLAEDRKRLKRISLVASSGRRTYRTMSDKQGWFKLTLPKPGNYRLRMLLPLYADVLGTLEQLKQISKRVVTKRGIVLEYDVVLEPGKCVFINPPLFIDYTEYEKHRGTNPLELRNKRSQRVSSRRRL
jgi:hypothetical protein